VIALGSPGLLVIVGLARDCCAFRGPQVRPTRKMGAATLLKKMLSLTFFASKVSRGNLWHRDDDD